MRIQLGHTYSDSYGREWSIVSWVTRNNEPQYVAVKVSDAKGHRPPIYNHNLTLQVRHFSLEGFSYRFETHGAVQLTKDMDYDEPWPVDVVTQLGGVAGA